MYDTVLSAIGDPEEFWRLVTAHLQLLASAKGEIPAIASDPLFSSRLVEVTHDLWESARRAAVAPDAETLRAAAADVLEAGHLLVEQPLKFHLGVACAATTAKTFADTQAGDVSELINIAGAKGWAITSGIGNSDLRNAFGHRDFAIVGGDVSLSPQRRRSRGAPSVVVSLDRVQDQALELLESISAMDLALALALEGVGEEIDVSPMGRILVRPFLTGLGWTEVNVTESDGDVCVSAEVHEAVPLSAISFVAQPFLDSGKRLHVRLSRSDTDTGTNSDIELDLNSYAFWASADVGIEKEAAFVRLGQQTWVNDAPLFDGERAERYLAFRGCQVLMDQQASHREVARQVKVWRGVARTLELKQVDRLLGKGLRLRTQSEAHITFDASEFDELIATAGGTVSEVPDTLI